MVTMVGVEIEREGGGGSQSGHVKVIFLLTHFLEKQDPYC